MEQAAPNDRSDRVLAGSASGQKLEMIRDSNGWLTITFNGEAGPGCRWPNERLDQCVAVFMALLRSPDGALVPDPAIASPQ
jgi:hypothetical protein